MEANNFRDWQADYAAHGVATFPVDANKRPMVSRYDRFGLIGSGKIASKFAAAPAIGFMCGKRNGITSLDCDSKDERVLTDALSRHGPKRHWSCERVLVISKPGIAIAVSAAGSAPNETFRSIFWAPALWWRH